VFKKRAPGIFLITQLKINRLQHFLAHIILKKCVLSTTYLKMSPLCRVKCRFYASDRSCITSLKSRCILINQFFPHNNLNFRQQHCMNCLKGRVNYSADVFCVLFIPVNRIMHHHVLADSRMQVDYRK